MYLNNIIPQTDISTVTTGMGDNTLAVVALFLGPIVAIIGSLLVYRASRQNNQSSVTVAQKEAATNEFSALTEGFVEQLTIVRAELKEVREEAKAAKVEVAAARRTIADLTGRVQTLEHDKQILQEHIILLEDTVPNPPGPPPRPFTWATNR